MIEEAEKKKAEPFLKKNRFKAKKVPKHVTEPLFKKIKNENEERR